MSFFVVAVVSLQLAASTSVDASKSAGASRSKLYMSMDADGLVQLSTGALRQHESSTQTGATAMSVDPESRFEQSDTSASLNPHHDDNTEKLEAKKSYAHEFAATPPVMTASNWQFIRGLLSGSVFLKTKTGDSTVTNKKKIYDAAQGGQALTEIKQTTYDTMADATFPTCKRKDNVNRIYAYCQDEAGNDVAVQEWPGSDQEAIKACNTAATKLLKWGTCQDFLSTKASNKSQAGPAWEIHEHCNTYICPRNGDWYRRPNASKIRCDAAKCTDAEKHKCCVQFINVGEGRCSHSEAGNWRVHVPLGDCFYWAVNNGFRFIAHGGKPGTWRYQHCWWHRSGAPDTCKNGPECCKCHNPVQTGCTWNNTGDNADFTFYKIIGA